MPRSAAIAVSVAALVVLGVVLVLAAYALAGKAGVQPTPRRPGAALLLPPGGELVDILGAGGSSGGATTAQVSVIPLYWDAPAGEYIIHFVAGTSEVTAAFDTGSARLVLATRATQSLSNTFYDPAKSRTSKVVPGPGGTGQCTFQQTYGSQSDTVAVWQDTVAFPRLTLDACQLCVRPLVAALEASPPGAPLSVTQFPVNGIVAGASDTGAPSINVFGMSAVRAAADCAANAAAGTGGGLPYKSDVLQAVAQYYTGLRQEVVWSMMLGTPTPSMAGFVCFGRMSVPCLRPQFTPLVPALPTATTPLTATPGRYYLVAVTGMWVGPTGTAVQNGTRVATFPQYLLVDSGTTQFMLPDPDVCAQLNTLATGQEAVLVLAGDVRVVYGPSDVVWEGADGSAQPVFAPISAAMEGQLSSTPYGVGIMGSTGLRNLYLEFNLTAAQLGFAQVCSACGTCA